MRYNTRGCANRERSASKTNLGDVMQAGATCVELSVKDSTLDWRDQNLPCCRLHQKRPCVRACPPGTRALDPLLKTRML